MKKEYPYLKQFFEQHKTKHSYKSFVRHRSPERLKQLDEICSNRPYKTRFEEYLKLSGKETFAQKIYKLKERIDNSPYGEDTGCVICIIFMILLLIIAAICKTILYSSILFSIFILLIPIYHIIDILGRKKLKTIVKSFPYYYYSYSHQYRPDDHWIIRQIRPSEISNKFAEECDICIQKFLDDFNLFYTENQKEISQVIDFYNQKRNKGLKQIQSKTEQSIREIHSCFCNINLFKFSSITKDILNSAYSYIHDSNIILCDQCYQINYNEIELNIKAALKRYDDSPIKAYIYTIWICLNLFCIGFTGYVFKVKHDLKDRSISSLYQKSYTRYENELRKWENGVFVKIGTSMTDYYRLGEDLSYGYTINGNDVSSNCIIGMPRDNHYVFGVSITEYDDTYTDYGSSSQSQYISKQDLIKGYKVVLETYVHENSTSSTQGYARFKTVFTLSFQNEEYKPREPQKSDFNDDVKVTFSDAFKSAIGLK